MQIRNRIKRFDHVPASELAKNPKNWRTHPDSQRRVLRDLLGEIGIVDAAIAYETPGGLVLIDGHLRTEEITDTPIPVLVLDVTEAEAEKVLVTLDPLAAMAGTDERMLSELVARIETDSAAVTLMLTDALEADGVIVPETGDKWPDPGNTENHTVTIRYTDDDLCDIKKWLLVDDFPPNKLGSMILGRIKSVAAN